VWTTDNHLSVVSTIIESLGSTHNDRGQVVVLMIQPMWKFFIDYLISTIDYELNT